MRRLEVLLSTKDKSGKYRYTKVGAAFVRDDGSIGVVIDPGVSVSTPEGTFLNLREPLPPREKSDAPKDDLPF